MRFPEHLLDEIRTRLPLSEVVGRKVSWDKRKSQPQRGDLWACCPFHQEKSPSLHVDDRKGFYHCLAAETGVITSVGVRPIAELAGQRHRVLTRGGKWVDAAFKGYGVQRLLSITLSRNGVAKVIHATEGHRWFIRGSNKARVTTSLKTGDRLQSVLPSLRSEWTLDPAGITHGIVFGDGTMNREVYGTVNLHGEKRELARFMVDGTASDHVDGDLTYTRVYGGRAYAHMKQLPELGRGEGYLLGFLAGLMATDGHVAKDGTVILNSANSATLRWVRDAATCLGIGTYGITSQCRQGIGGVMSEIHRIHFIPSTLTAGFFLKPSAHVRFREHGKRFDRLRWSIVSVAETDREEEVFCAEVPDEHAFALEDHILTGNCFGCGASGDHIRFVMETEGLSFPETVERLAAEAGVPLPARDAESERRDQRRKGLAEAVELAALYFEQRFRSGAGREAREYAERRALTPETLHAFRIGYSPGDRDALTRHLVASGVDEATIVEAGLAGRPEDGRAVYDRFRNRLMIPIHDARGRVVAFGGRALSPGQEPKYLNSPETPLFSKRAVLFNAHRAREAAHTSGSVVVVEGYLDAIAVAQAGIRGVVATLGTAFTEEQIRALWRLAPEPVICFDGDKAGISAAHRAIDRILPLVEAGRSFNFAFLPEGKDPDDLIADGGAARFLAEVKAAAPLFDVMMDRELADARLDTPERRAALEKRLDELVGTIRDARVSREYRAALKLRLSERLWRNQGERAAARGYQQRGERGRPAEPPGAALSGPLTTPPKEPGAVDRLVLGLLVEHPGLVAAHYERIAHLPLRNERHRAFRDALLDVVADAAHGGGEHEDVAAGDVLARLDGPFFQVLREVHGGGRGLRRAFGLLTFHPSADFVERYVLLLVEKIEIAVLAEEIAALTHAAGESIDEEAWQRLRALSAEHARREGDYQADERALADEARKIRAAYGAGASLSIEAAGG